MKIFLAWLVIIIFSIVAVLFIFGEKPMTFYDHIGLWLITLNGYIAANLQD